jgi:hypothetical protein
VSGGLIWKRKHVSKRGGAIKSVLALAKQSLSPWKAPARGGTSCAINAFSWSA